MLCLETEVRVPVLLYAGVVRVPWTSCRYFTVDPHVGHLPVCLD